jgi:murein DD-endopeptidase MepM/ murein hydrolase activator NlpD
VRPHRAIDYAAPAGTPVVAIGRGRVEFSGWRDGYGNLVEIRHAGGYVSRYGHFSRIAGGIRHGVRVNQGDVIGYVGQTGHATGPHLHFEFLRGGEKINFLALKIPRIERLTEADLRRFMLFRDAQLALLHSIGGQANRSQSGL